MALTDAQKAQCRMYLGWSMGYDDRDSHLERSMNGLDSKPEVELLITDTLVNGGILATLAAIDAKLIAAHNRLKAAAVGSITLNAAELQMLCREGNRIVARLARLLGVEVREGGGYSSALPSGRTESGAYYPGGNYIGK